MGNGVKFSTSARGAAVSTEELKVEALALWAGMEESKPHTTRSFEGFAG